VARLVRGDAVFLLEDDRLQVSKRVRRGKADNATPDDGDHARR
jgi:hypothetical protein